RDVMWLCIKRGVDFVVKGGSYVGQIRKQLSHVTIVIEQPWLRPLSPVMSPGTPGPTNDEKIEEYFTRYIMSDEVAENEVYTYGTFIVKQIERIVQLLNDAKGNTNQACIAIGDTQTTFLADPPCLRLCSFKVVNGHLVLTVFFRSWDLYAGLPENLGGLQFLKEYVLAHLTFPCKDGALIACSDGLHLYEQYFKIANTLNVDKIVVSNKALADKQKMGELGI
ncbi:hypothetical protein LCGC14_1169990, partial [marine sediment metagenome]